MEPNLDFEKAKSHLSTLFQRHHKRAQRRVSEMQATYEAALNWEKIFHEGELLKANYAKMTKGMQKIVVWDWQSEKEVELSLHPTKKPHEQVSDRFKKSRKLQRGIPHLEKQLNLSKEKIETLDKGIQLLQEITSLEQLETLKKEYKLEQSLPTLKKQFKKVEILPYIEYESASGIKIWVGKSAKNNDMLTFSLARGSDWWLHVHHFSGSHVVIKSDHPDQETILDAAQLAIFYSKAKNQGEGEVCLTQRKYVTRFGRGQPGKVQISKHKLLFIRADLERVKRIKKTKG